MDDYRSATISNPTGPATDVSNLVLGTNTFCWTIDNGACDPPTTTDCVDIIMFPEDQLPGLGPIKMFVVQLPIAQRLQGIASYHLVNMATNQRTYFRHF